MRVAPYIFYPDFDKTQLLLHECSDRLLLPQYYCDEANFKVDDILMLTNIYNQSLCGTVYGAHTQDPTVIFAPSWMIHNLDCLDPLTISHVAKIPPTGLRIRPHSEKFASNPNFVKLINGAMSNYKSITKNTRISLLINGQIEYLTVEDLLPSKVFTCFVYNCGKVDIKIVDATPPKKQKPEYLFRSPLQDDYKFSFFGIGYTLGGIMDLSASPVQAAAAAARRRFDLMSRGLRPY